MEMLWKIIDGKSLEICWENAYERVSFSKVTNLQCSDCNFAIKIAHHRYFLEYIPKTSCLFWEKSLWWTSFLIKLQPCSTQPSVLWKNGACVRLSSRSAESSNILTGKCLWWRLFFTKDGSLQFIPAISLKRIYNTVVFPYAFFTVTLLKLSKSFLRDVFAKHFLTKSQASNL